MRASAAEAIAVHLRRIDHVRIEKDLAHRTPNHQDYDSVIVGRKYLWKSRKPLK
jgi:hypothetical protein